MLQRDNIDTTQANIYEDARNSFSCADLCELCVSGLPGGISPRFLLEIWWKCPHTVIEETVDSTIDEESINRSSFNPLPANIGMQKKTMHDKMLNDSKTVRFLCDNMHEKRMNFAFKQDQVWHNQRKSCHIM